jgi:long-chain acyl-CoA synthetase
MSGAQTAALMGATIYFDPQPEADFDGRCARSASALSELGAGPGDVVALMLHNEPVLLELMQAVRSVGAYYCLINWNFKSAEVRHILNDSAAKVLIVHAPLESAIRDAIPAGLRVFVVAPRERTCEAFGYELMNRPLAPGHESWQSWRDAHPRPAFVMQRPGSPMVYTSGTSGLPKGIRRQPPTAGQTESLMQMTRVALGIAPGMRALVSAPIYHSAPSSYVTQSMLHGAHLWIEPRFDAQHTLRLIDAHRLTHAYLVPTMMRRLLRLPPEVKAAYDVSSLQFVASTGAPCPIGTKEQMIDWWGPVIHESYAASELGYVTHIDSHDAQRKPGSAGRAIPGTVLKILSDTGEELPAGSVGQIYARTGTPDFTYSNNDQARRALERDGLWSLADVGYLDEEGFLFIVDRKADMVISGGVNIYPAEIEAMLALMDGVADSAVFGIPDEEFGESLLAAIQPSEPGRLTAEKVRAYLHDRLAGYKVPRQIVFHDQLPREETGKIFKRKLREPYWKDKATRV